MRDFTKLNSSKNNSFSVLMDYDDQYILSKKIYIPTKMFGLMKYRYRPNIGIYNIYVWSGLHFGGLIMLATPENTALLQQYPIFYNSFYFETDDNGFKKTEFLANSDYPTIFFLGDSMTEGLYVVSKDTFVNLFGKRLKADKIPTIAINLGVAGNSVLEMSWLFEHYAPSLNPKLVILNLFPNDVHSNYFRAITGEGIPEKNYQEMFYYLKRIQNYCRKFNIRLVVVVIPAKAQFRGLRKFSYFQDRVKEWCKAQGIPFLDPRNYFEKFGWKEIYFSWDLHFSVKGHRHYANFLYQNIYPIILKEFIPYMNK